MRGRLGLTLFATGLLAGCATVQSEPGSSEATLSATSAGVTYFLPKKLVKLTIGRAPVDLAKLKKARDAKMAALEEATTAQTAADTEAEKAKAVLDHLAPDATARPDQQKAADLAAAKLELANAAVAEATTALQKATEDLLFAMGHGETCSYDAKLELLPAQPDQRRRYVAELRHNWLRDDTVTLGVNPGGLLTSANIVAVDRTGDIIVEAAGAIAGLGGGGRGVGRSAAPVPAALSCGEPRKLVLIFDPNDELAMDEVAARLAVADYPYRVGPRAEDALKTLPEILAARPAADKKADEAAAADQAVATKIFKSYRGALFYRSPAPMTVTLERQVGNDWHIVDASVVMIPQAGPVSYIPANSSAFVKTVDDVTFIDGVVASWSPDRPSEVLEIVRLPMKVAMAIISVPAQLISLKVDYSSKAKSLAEAQAAEVGAQRSLIKLRNCLATADANGTPAEACLPAVQ
jgi:hypothetical protein